MLKDDDIRTEISFELQLILNETVFMNTFQRPRGFNHFSYIKIILLVRNKECFCIFDQSS